MSEYFNEAAIMLPDDGSEEDDPDRSQEEFRAYLEREFGMTDSARQDVVMGLFRFSAIKSARDLGILPYWDPMEAARQQLIAQGITDPEEQKPALHRLYQDLEDPRPTIV